MDLDGDGYITPGTGTNGNPGDQTVIGNSTPRYEYSFRLGADYKGIDFSIFFQGIGKRQIWGSGQLAIPGYNAKEGALPKTLHNRLLDRRAYGCILSESMEFGWKQYWFQYAETVTLFAGYVLPENQEYNVGIYFPGESSFKSVYIQGQTLYVIRELLYI